MTMINAFGAPVYLIEVDPTGRFIGLEGSLLSSETALSPMRLFSLLQFHPTRASRQEEIEIRYERNNKQDYDQIGSESIIFFLSSRALSLNTCHTRGSAF